MAEQATPNLIVLGKPYPGAAFGRGRCVTEPLVVSSGTPGALSFLHHACDVVLALAPGQERLL